MIRPPPISPLFPYPTLFRSLALPVQVGERRAAQELHELVAEQRLVDALLEILFTQREKDFEERIYQALFGDELVKLLSGPTLADLDRQGKRSEERRVGKEWRYRGWPYHLKKKRT